MVLLVTALPGTVVTIKAHLQNKIPLRKDDAHSLGEVSAICSGSNPPKCLLIFEKGFELDMESPTGRYAILQELHDKHPEIPIVFCSAQPDEKFYAHAKERCSSFLDCHIGIDPALLATVIKALLNGEAPKVAEPELVLPKSESGLQGWETSFRNFLNRRPIISHFRTPNADEQKPDDDALRSMQEEQIAKGVILAQTATPLQVAEEPTPILQPEYSVEQEIQSNESKLVAEKQSVFQDSDVVSLEDVAPPEERLELFDSTLEAVGKPGFWGVVASIAAPYIRVDKTPRHPAHNDHFSFPEKDVIGVMALSHGAGATYTAIQIADYLMRYGTTVILAFDGSDDLTFAGIDQEIMVHIPTAAERRSTIAKAHRDGFRFIVIDFGAPFELTSSGFVVDSALSRHNEAIEELSRCSRLVCLRHDAKWHRNRNEFLATSNLDRNVTYLSANDRDMDIEQLMGKVYPGFAPRRLLGISI